MSTLIDELTTQLQSINPLLSSVQTLELEPSRSYIVELPRLGKWYVRGPYDPGGEFNEATYALWSDYCKTQLIGVEAIGATIVDSGRYLVMNDVISPGLIPAKPSCVLKYNLDIQLSFIMTVFYRYVMEIPGTDSSTVLISPSHHCCYSLHEYQVMKGGISKLFRTRSVARSYRDTIHRIVDTLRNTIIVYLRRWTIVELPMGERIVQKFNERVEQLITACGSDSFKLLDRLL